MFNFFIIPTRFFHSIPRGVVADEGGSLFENAHVEEILEGVPWAPSDLAKPRHVLITCDPNARDKRTSSEMALVACVLDSGRYVVSFKKGEVQHLFLRLATSRRKEGGGTGRLQMLTYSARR